MVLSNADNSGTEPVDASGSVSKDAYAIKLTYAMTMTETDNATTYESPFHNEDYVTSFSITSLNTFNSIPPNESLHEFFNYRKSYAGPGSPIVPGAYSGYASGSMQTPGNFGDYEVEHYLFLMTPPATGGTYIFIVRITFSDGREIVDTVTANLI